MHTTVKMLVTDQAIHLSSLPLLASGGINEVRVELSFCGLWDGFGKTAVFYRRKEEVYHVPLADDACIVPWEVLTEPGRVYFGVYGAASEGDVTRTTELLILTIEQGAITAATTTQREPTPEVYQQLLAAYGQLQDACSSCDARHLTVNLEGAVEADGTGSYVYPGLRVTHDGAGNVTIY